MILGNFFWIRQRLSSAHYPQSNGRAEAAVKTAKRLLMDNTERGVQVDTDEVAKALLQYSNTLLLVIGFSPAQMLFGRQLKDASPIPPESLRWNSTSLDYDKRLG